ncbi:MFS transporter [Actinotignum timonense]|uniref:MFS transporter n=1 Tax=Actinotignum timonense TaxID=1870995 RepID=A0AAW9HL61_9ACTO|nr:MFS transporter [Actinotignum timonense]MDY5141276.1 MFS transporter [Actinotignum timonense]
MDERENKPAEGASVSPSTDLYSGKALFALMVTLITAVLSYQLNASMITPALPNIGESYAISESTVGLVSSLFFLAGSIAGVVLTRWSDFIGRKKMLIYVLLVLLVGTIICAVAPNFTIFMVGRVLQGASGATFQLTYMILSESVTAKTFGTMMGFITAINGGVGGLDGWLGGVMVEKWGFRSLFILIAVLVVLAAILINRGISTEHERAGSGKMDWGGSAAMSITLIMLTYFVTFGGPHGWLSVPAIGFFAGTVVSAAAFYIIEVRSESPLFAMEHLGSRHVWPLILTTLFALSSVFAVINFTVAIFAQSTDVGYGLDAGTAALLFLMPPAMVGLIAAPISGRLAGKIGWLTVLRVGMAISIAAMVVIYLYLDSRWVVCAMIFLLGVSYNGMILTMVNGLGVLLAPPEAPGSLPGFNGAAFGIGASLGISIVAPFVGTFEGFRTAVLISVGIAILGLLTAFVLKPRVGQKI